MRCDPVRDALSARLDGEAAGLDEDAIDRHLAGCAACARWSEDLTTLHRMVRIRPADAVPDLSEAILVAAGARPRTHRRLGAEPVSVARWALFSVALTQLLLAVPGLVLGDNAGATIHVARELGGFDVAVAAGLLVAAWQPWRATGLLPVVTVLGAAVLGTAALDLLDGSTTAGSESRHLFDLCGLILLWVVARQAAGAPTLSTAGVPGVVRPGGRRRG